MRNAKAVKVQVSQVSKRSVELFITSRAQMRSTNNCVDSGVTQLATKMLDRIDQASMGTPQEDNEPF